MRTDILIVGQGLAGTLLAWEFERAGIAFTIADPGAPGGASRIAAGMINPITGQRFVKSWRIDSLLPFARAAYLALEAGLGVPLWHELRVRRLFAAERERQVARDKQARGELAPYVTAAIDDDGFWIEHAARINLPALLDAAQQRWRQRGWLRREAVAVDEAREKFHLVIDCTGATGARGELPFVIARSPAPRGDEAIQLDRHGALRAPRDDKAEGSAARGVRRAAKFDFVPWEFSKGEMLALEVDGLEAGVVLNQGHWLLPVGPRMAWIGATHEPKFTDLAPSAAGRTALEASAGALLGRPFSVVGHSAGVRVNLPDKRPVVGRHPADPRLGLVNGLGAKGALWAPVLARQWVNHLTEGVPFDPELDVARFAAE